jgi:hypothetical protein
MWDGPLTPTRPEVQFLFDGGILFAYSRRFSRVNRHGSERPYYSGPLRVMPLFRTGELLE